MKTRIECEEITGKMLEKVSQEMKKFDIDEIRKTLLEKEKNKEGITLEEIDLIFEKKKKIFENIRRISSEDYCEELGLGRDFLKRGNKKIIN